MGDVAQGIKAFKKGMADDDKAVEPKKIDGQPVDPAAQHAQTERKFEGTTG
jgi:sec-independent protein translocase protein TatA